MSPVLNTFAAILLSIALGCSAVALADTGSDLLNLLDGNSGEAATSADPAGDRIDASSTAADDEQVRQRLLQIYAQLEGLGSVDVNVSSSIVTLTGEISVLTLSEQAEELAQQIDGVVEVNNQLDVSRDVGERINTTWDKLRRAVMSLYALLPLLFIALSTIVVFWFLARKVSQQRHWFRHLAPNGFIAGLLATIVRLSLILIGIILALYLLDATSILGTVLGAAGLVGLAVGFAVRDTVENFIASILLSLRNPFAVHDLVEIDSNLGTVARLTSRATILISPDGNQIRIPNAAVYKSIITNYTQQSNRRFVALVPIDESENLALARRVAREALLATPGVLTEPEPLLIVEELGEAINQLQVHGWVNQQEHHIQKVQTAAVIRIKHAFKAAGIVMPESVHTIRLKNLQNQGIDLPESKVRQEKATASKPADRTGGVPQAAELDVDEDTRPDTAVLDQVDLERAGSENLLDAAGASE